MENEAYLSMETGEIHWHFEDADELEPLPSDIDDDEKYLAIPHKSDLDLGKRLALAFVEEAFPELLEDVRETFSHRGAYSRFKTMLERRGMLDRWYEYEAKAQEEALRKWCAARGVGIDG